MKRNKGTLTERENGLPAHDLRDKRVDVWHLRRVVEVRQPVAPDDRVELCLSLAHHLWVMEHGQEEHHR